MVENRQSLAAEQLLTTESQKAVVSLFILLSRRCKGAWYNKDKYKQTFNIEEQSGFVSKYSTAAVTHLNVRTAIQST